MVAQGVRLLTAKFLNSLWIRSPSTMRTEDVSILMRLNSAAGGGNAQPATLLNRLERLCRDHYGFPKAQITLIPPY